MKRPIKKMSPSGIITIEARFLFFSLSSIGTILRTKLNEYCKNYLFQYRTETTQTILGELNKIKVDRVNQTYILRYALTARQKQILSYFEINKKYLEKRVNDLNFSKTID